MIAGLWIFAGRRLIDSVLHHCVTCHKLRGKLEVQKMANLPPVRLSSFPPFTWDWMFFNPGMWLRGAPEMVQLRASGGLFISPA